MGEPKKDVLYGANTIYRETGYYLMNRRKNEKCIKQFDLCLELDGTQKRALCGRSWARTRILQYQSALEDIEKAITLYPSDKRSKGIKALITYLSKNFEDAYVQNTRGEKIRIRPPWFIQGSIQCNETIENCLGKRVGHPLRDYYDIIRTLAMKRAYDLRKGFQVKSKYKKKKKKPKTETVIHEKGLKSMKVEPITVESKVSVSTDGCKGSILESLNEKDLGELMFKPIKKSEYQPLQKCTTNIDNMLAEKYLEKMCIDKFFLKELRGDPRLDCPNYAGKMRIVALAKNGFKDIWTRQEILRTRRPFYGIKYLEGQLSGALLKRQLEDLIKQQFIVKENVENLLADLHRARLNLLTQECIQIADKMKTYIDKTPLKVLPKKEGYLRNLYELIGVVHLETYRLSKHQTDYEQQKRIQYLFGKVISREPSQDSVIKNCKGGFLDIKQAIWLTEKRMQKATTPLETVWLYYEFCRFNIELKKWDLARVYGRKCINLSRMLGNYIWATNASMQICKAHVQQGRRNDAKNELYRTKEFAERLNNPGILDYIDKCLGVVEQIDVAETHGSKVIQVREKEIMGAIMQLKLKTEVSHLFAKMSAIPNSRRLSIMPGVNIEDEEILASKMDLKKSLKTRQSINPNDDEDDFADKLRQANAELLATVC